MRAALARIPVGDRRRWAAFDAPRAVLRAEALDEVRGCVEAADAAARDGSWVVAMVAYDAAPAFDPAARARRRADVPLACFGVFDDVRLVDAPPGGRFDIGGWTPSWSAEDHTAAVGQVRRHLRDGDAYQVNLTLRLRTRFAGDPAGLFAALTAAQPTESGVFVDLGATAVCCASPELFLRRDGDAVEMRPMKGTRSRSGDVDLVEAEVDELRAAAKDRAENVMIVDMARNDLGRVAEIGSVQVPELFVVESHPTVHQMVSVVTARSSATLAQLLEATFPAASITGAPKVAATRIIAALEPEPRGIYTGAVGVVRPGGGFELAVAIRTAWVDRVAGAVEYGVGGGIVWDSTPDGEWGEAMDKARLVTDLSPAVGAAPRAR
ncbi:MAG TPA: chorismate-binding protein [Acidimicrobiales bacterium]|nr:chorismate-binding protein [Acidimicrobiales bacterium]